MTLNRPWIGDPANLLYSPDGHHLECDDAYVSWPAYGDPKYACLDGCFTVEQLKGIVAWIEAHQ